MFINELEILEEGYGFRLMEQIKVSDKLAVSVQVSEGHYCSPRETLSDLRSYEYVEFAIFENNEFSTVKKASPEYSRLEEFYNYMDGDEECSTVVYGYVPVELVQHYINYLRK